MGSRNCFGELNLYLDKQKTMRLVAIFIKEHFLFSEPQIINLEGISFIVLL